MSIGYPGRAAELHVTPRRVRVRSSLMKRNAERALQAERELAALPGIAEARISPTTGSIVLHFTAARWTAEALLAHLREHGYLDRDLSRSAHPVRHHRGREVFTECCVLIAKELLGAAISEFLPHPLVATLLAVV
jgi:hypothetical protein